MTQSNRYNSCLFLLKQKKQKMLNKINKHIFFFNIWTHIHKSTHSYNVNSTLTSFYALYKHQLFSLFSFPFIWILYTANLPYNTSKSINVYAAVVHTAVSYLYFCGLFVLLLHVQQIFVLKILADCMRWKFIAYIHLLLSIYTPKNIFR